MIKAKSRSLWKGWMTCSLGNSWIKGMLQAGVFRVLMLGAQGLLLILSANPKISKNRFYNLLKIYRNFSKNPMKMLEVMDINTK